MEERVRKWFLEQLTFYGIARYRIATEYSVAIGGRRLRADIVVFAQRSTDIVAVVECKAPTVPITEQTMRQAAIYNSELNARYLILTNGTNTYIYDCQSGVYLKKLPADLADRPIPL